MLAGLLTYRVGNENDPTDPWGRSELFVDPDGSVWLEHHFSRRRGPGNWFGRVDSGLLDALSDALDVAGFGLTAAPQPPLVPDATIRMLTVTADGTEHAATVAWHRAATLPGYAEAFDLLDGLVRQLSGEAVRYPTSQSKTIVHAAAAFAWPVAAILETAGQPVKGDELSRAELNLAIAQRRVLQVRYVSSVGDGQAWYGPADSLGFDREGNPARAYLAFPRPVPGALRREYGGSDWESESQVYAAFGVTSSGIA